MIDNQEPFFDAIVMHDDDSVATVLINVVAGTQIRLQSLDVLHELYISEDIPLYHKVAIRVIETGEEVLKNGHVIGIATMQISAGSHVHVHNLVGRDPVDCL